ncbi:MAG: FAD-dependent oxidoreductase [Candidatus Nezhaarchaeota archaeon]|nr:FAD-dependent oxidoreductase [Candidatus Nezhaarchaeota archaeon]
MARFIVDGAEVEARPGESVLKAALSAGIYIPHLCYHPDLPPLSQSHLSVEKVYLDGVEVVGEAGRDHEGCRLCLIKVEGVGELVRACVTEARDGMVVHTNLPEVVEARRKRLAEILATHPHACLTCANREGCDRIRCSLNVPQDERCCVLLGRCELGKVADYVGIPPETAKYVPRGLPVVKEEPLFVRDYNLCVGCARCVRMCGDVRGVKALAFTATSRGVVVGTVASTLKDSGCKFCGSCVEVCPTGALLDKDVDPAKRIEMLVPCKHACPAGVDVPSYVRLIAEGREDEALAVIREKVPFPGVLGYVCMRPCEDKCRRGKVNEAIAIRALKRYVYRGEGLKWRPLRRGQPTGKRVAIVGSGPAGLTAAYILALKGHDVTVFEAEKVPGGMMAIAIPKHRLPREVLEAEVKEVEAAGVELKLGHRVTNLDRLLREFDAVLLATGAQLSPKLGIEGEDLQGVYQALDFLRRVNLEGGVEVGRRVVVVGGGNTAMDCARTALRLGAEEVVVSYRRTRDEMPAHPIEVAEAEEEGVKFLFLTAPVRIVGEGGRARGVELIRMRLEELDEKGRRRPVPIEGSEFLVEADCVIVAIGQLVDTSIIPKGLGVKLSPRGTVEVKPETLETSVRGLFAAGDVVSGPASVIEAVAAGRLAASSIDKFLGGSGVVEPSLTRPPPPKPWLGRDENFAYWPRINPPLLPPSERRACFATVEGDFSKDQAVREASRCLRCDLRLTISSPILPPERWVSFTAEAIEAVPEVEGVIQLLSENKEVIYIKGTANMREELRQLLGTAAEAKYFTWEEAKMYTSRESELLQRFIQLHGRLPKMNLGLEEELYE